VPPAKVESFVWSVFFFLAFLPAFIGLWRRSPLTALYLTFYLVMLIAAGVAASYNMGLLMRMRIMIIPLIVFVGSQQVEIFLRRWDAARLRLGKSDSTSISGVVQKSID